MKTYSFTANGRFPGDKLKGKDRYKKLYHYTSFDTFVKIWLSKQLRYSPVTNVNDIQEAESSASVPHPNQTAIIYAYHEVRQKYKQISFTMDFDSYMKGCMSPMMWGHYADKRKGVCIEIDFEKLNLSNTCFAAPIKYKQVLNKSRFIDSKVITIRQIHQFIRKYKSDIFFTKQKCWSGENEFRIISAIDNNLNIRDAITAVYLTSCDSTECLLTEQLVGDSVPVKFLHYIGGVGNKALPVISDTRPYREHKETIINSPRNFMYKWSNMAIKLYEKHKDDEDYPLLLNSYN